jgi:L-asparaginase
MAALTLVVRAVKLPALVIHGGAGAYLKTTTREQRLTRGARLGDIVRRAAREFGDGGAHAAVMHAIADLEDDPSFNAGFGSRLQRDGKARLSASIMDGQQTRLGAVYNVEGCRHPSVLADHLLARGDRNLDGTGAQALMDELGIAPQNVRSDTSIARWQALIDSGEQVDREGAIGNASAEDAMQALRERLPVPADLDAPASPVARPPALPPDGDRYGTVGAVACDDSGAIWACTSTGGRGHEVVGRISDSATPAGNYACPLVALSATGFGEQIIDMNVCGRIATRMLDGADLEAALARSFEEVMAASGLLGVIGISRDGHAAYAHTTDACGVAWIDAAGAVHIDAHGRG